MPIAHQYMSPIPCLTGFNIRNGDQSEAKRLVVRENISRTWHWSPIEGLNPEVAIKKKYDFIRQEIARMTIHPETGVNHTLEAQEGYCNWSCQGCIHWWWAMTVPYWSKDADSKWNEELSKQPNLSVQVLTSL